ncbi:MAG: hypothetical protein ABFD64_13695 [Armatimonadota bacterium]
MLIAFAAGWILGSFSLYCYLILTAKEPPRAECVDCREESCDGCTKLESDQENYKLAA